MGYHCGGDHTQMVPVLLGDDELTFTVTQALARRGVCVSPAVSPGVPKGSALLRLCFPPTMSTAMRERAYEAFAQVAAECPGIRSGRPS
jgi:8-amino-7-oxononanoate synthase